MKKIINVLCVIILIVILCTHISYAISNVNKNNEEFVSLNKTEISPEEVLEINIDLEKIEYEKFKIILTSSLKMNDLYTKDDTSLNTENNEATLEIDKATTNISKITLYYPIEKNISVGSTVNFSTKVISEIDTVETTVREQKFDIKIIENTPDNKQPEQANTKNTDNKESKESTAKPQSINDNKSVKVQTTKVASNPDEKYNGSSNNYLSKLEISNVDLNTKFTKENSTYYAEITKKDTLNVKANAEDDGATICITGNDNLKNGINKILISISAKNGNVRYYRVYVNVIANNNDSKEKAKNVNQTVEIKSSSEEKVLTRTGYYLEKVYVQNNQYVKKGTKILKYTNGKYLYAPYNCVVTKLNLPDIKSKLLNTHYIQIASQDSLKTSISIDEELINNIKIGQEAEIEVPAISKTLTGYITNISSIASNGSFTATIEFKNDGNIKLGMTANVKI